MENASGARAVPARSGQDAAFAGAATGDRSRSGLETAFSKHALRWAPIASTSHLELLEAVPTRGEQRRLIMSFVRSLTDNPHTAGDFTDRDESLRTRQIKIIGRYAVTYWVDDPVKAVMIISVEIADR